MKDIYEKPIAQIDEFETVDVITTSGEIYNDPDTDIPWGS